MKSLDTMDITAPIAKSKRSEINEVISVIVSKQVRDRWLVTVLY